MQCQRNALANSQLKMPNSLAFSSRQRKAEVEASPR